MATVSYFEAKTAKGGFEGDSLEDLQKKIVGYHSNGMDCDRLPEIVSIVVHENDEEAIFSGSDLLFVKFLRDLKDEFDDSQNQCRYAAEEERYIRSHAGRL